MLDRLLTAARIQTRRLYPPIPIDLKAARKDDVLPDGTRVRKGEACTPRLVARLWYPIFSLASDGAVRWLALALDPRAASDHSSPSEAPELIEWLACLIRSAGDVIFYSPFVFGRSPKLWPEPLRFCPERCGSSRSLSCLLAGPFHMLFAERNVDLLSGGSKALWRKRLTTRASRPRARRGTTPPRSNRSKAALEAAAAATAAAAKTKARAIKRRRRLWRSLTRRGCWCGGRCVCGRSRRSNSSPSTRARGIVSRSAWVIVHGVRCCEACALCLSVRGTSIVSDLVVLSLIVHCVSLSTCLGRNAALLEAKFVAARVLQRFSLE